MDKEIEQVNSIENIQKIIYLLDKQILKILSSKEVNEDKLSDLTDIRVLYIEELNNLVRSKNISGMYNKKYWKSYKRP